MTGWSTFTSPSRHAARLSTSSGSTPGCVQAQNTRILSLHSVFVQICAPWPARTRAAAVLYQRCTVAAADKRAPSFRVVGRSIIEPDLSSTGRYPPTTLTWHLLQVPPASSVSMHISSPLVAVYLHVFRTRQQRVEKAHCQPETRRVRAADPHQIQIRLLCGDGILAPRHLPVPPPP